MDENSKRLDAALEGIDDASRTKLRRLLLKCSFVTPIVASFGMATLNIADAVVSASNTTRPPRPRPRPDDDD